MTLREAQKQVFPKELVKFLVHHLCRAIGTSFALGVTARENLFLSHMQVGAIMITTCANLLSMTAKDLMTKKVINLQQEMSIKEAAQILAKNEISGAPVVDSEGRCIGVFSTTDLLRGYSGHKNARTVPFERELTCRFVRTTRDADGRESNLCTLPLGVCAIQRHHKGASGNEVVTCSEPHAVPVEWGVVEVEKLPDDPVQCYMTADPVTVDCDSGIRDVARKMIDAHIHRVIVVDASRHPVGILSSSDILAAVSYASEP